MKLKDYFSRSLSRQFVLLMAVFIAFFAAGMIALFAYQQKMNSTYLQERKENVNKRHIIDHISDYFNTAFFEARGYLALNNPALKKHALDQKPLIIQQTSKFKDEASTDDDQQIYQDITDFTNYYFNDVFLPAVKSFESGDHTTYKTIANQGATARIGIFQKELNSYTLSLDNKMDKSAVKLAEKQLWMQIGLVVYLALLLIVMMRMIRMIFRNIGTPLADFAAAANEIAAGREAEIMINEKRKDELGILSVAFKKMIASIQDKEQDLMAQNEELFAQQDELQAQQDELEEALRTLMDNERNLTMRNELIHGISSTLQKDEVLSSIVVNMCRLIQADRGMISLLKEESHSSFGISEEGARQFLNHLNNGLNLRLQQTKKPFMIKREQQVAEKGYHENIQYCYDLYLPVLSAENEVAAVMIYSRFSGAYTEKEIQDYEALTKQIAISLDKLQLYEKSEDNRKMNQDILNTVQEGIQLINCQGTIVQANHKLCEIFGCNITMKKIIGLKWDEWTRIMAERIEEGDFLETLNKMMKELEENEESDHSFIYTSKADKRVIKVYCEKLKIGEEIFGTVMVHRDITREFEVDMMKSEFVSTVSHELRTPLASVLGFTELMMNRELKPEKQKKYLQTIYNEAKRLTALINDFLDVQRMESGKETYEKKYFDPFPMLQKTIELHEVNLAHHSIELKAETESSMILGDRSKVEQAFINLLSNAIKYSPEGGSIAVRIYDSEHDFRIEVRDRGLGIPPEAVPHLFQKFYRVDNTDRRRIGGTGLGLAIVDEIMKAHGGSVMVESEYGNGSIFTLSFPKVMMSQDEKETDAERNEHFCKIMVIEDDVSLAELLHHELLDSGFRVSFFKSGTKALAALKRNPPDAVVLDIMLDGDKVDGWAIMKEIKEDEKLKNIPIFVSTALDEKEKGFSLGAQDYLIKPYKPSQLSKMIKHTLWSTEKQGQILIPQENEM